MSSDPIRRRETTHIDEVARTATSTTQWFAEKLHATHPISHNNRLKMFVCGEEGFADIQTQLENAKATIDLICWGFDPGMELKRGSGTTWPRGKTYGDLLIECGNRGVNVRLLVWYDRFLGLLTKNMPGCTHGLWTWRHGYDLLGTDKVSAKHSLAMLQAKCKGPRIIHKAWRLPITPDMIPLLAREEYCHAWYEAAFEGKLHGIEVRRRATNKEMVDRSLSSEQYQLASMTASGFERFGLLHAATHHQKTILIDFMHEEGKKAVGYVMGLNSVTDYWDTCEHRLEDPRREQGGDVTASEAVQPLTPKIKPDAGFLSLKPYQDYACRIEGGKALISLYNNFVTAWDRSINDTAQTAANKCMKRFVGPCKAPPTALLRKAIPGDSTVQIVRTQPDENDKSIKDIYCLATDAACLGGGYLYIENQYFQNEEWAQRLIQKRQEVVTAWKRAAAKTGKRSETLPMLHVFIVMPVPEKAQMIPSTHDTLAVLGESQGMTGQNGMINKANNWRPQHYIGLPPGVKPYNPGLPDVVKHANELEKRTTINLEDVLGLKVSVAMLQTSGFDKRRWRYREIYIHSKLLLVDDEFMTLGSANLNQRSMAVDSELNIATNDAELVRDLRARIWDMHSGGKVDGKNGTQAEIAGAFIEWQDLMVTNLSRKKAGEKMLGFILPLADSRCSTLRLG